MESDEQTIEEQWGILTKLWLPVAAVIFSGNRSLHTLCRIDAGRDGKLYKKRVDALFKYVTAHGLKIDTSCRNPSRLTRMPGGLRGEKVQYAVSWEWGYPDWNSFEAAELQVPTPAAVQDKEQKPALTTETLTEPFPFELGEDGKVSSLNQTVCARYVVDANNLLRVEEAFWAYDAVTGLWKQLSPANLNLLIAETIRNLAQQYGLRVESLLTARFCKDIQNFMPPQENAPLPPGIYRVVEIPIAPVPPTLPDAPDAKITALEKSTPLDEAINLAEIERVASSESCKELMGMRSEPEMLQSAIS